MHRGDQESIACKEHPPVPQLKHKLLLQLMEWKYEKAKSPESPALKPAEYGFYLLKLSDFFFFLIV